MKLTKKLTGLILSIMMLLTVLVGCSDKTVTMQDREGNDFTKPSKVERIISTAPSNTEVLVALGMADKLVAVDKYSEDVKGISEDIPKINFRNPDAETIIGLEPDIIIASGHNKVGDNDPFQLVKEAGIPVVYIPSSYSIDGIYGDINFISEITKTEKQGKEIVENMKKDVEDIRAIGEKITDKKKVYFEIGSGSKLSSFGQDTFLNEMIQIIGAENIFANEKSWISPTPESIIEANPDVILTNMPDINGVKAVDEIKSRDGWDSVTAIKEGNVYGIDKNASARPSQNVVKALKEMAKAVYPNEYK